MNLGTVVMGASYLIANGPIVNAPQGTINSQSYNMTLQASLDNQGTLNVSNSLNWKNRGASLNTGTINVSGFATILTLDQSAAGSSFSTSGTVTVGSGDTFTVLQGGYSQSAGTTEVAGMLLVNGNFHPGSGTVAVALNGTTPGTSYGQIKVNGTVALGGPLNVALGYTPSIGDSFRIIDNDGADPISGTFSGLPERAILTTGGQTFRVSYVGGTGNDVTLTRYNPGAASVTSLVVGDGSAQRSSIKQIKVSFDRIISYVGLPSDAYSLQVVNGGFVGLSIATVTVGDHSEVTLTFTSDVSFGSLNDGRYIFTVHGAQIVSDGVPMTSDVVNNFFRMYGDANGDGIVNGADLSLFASTFGKKAGDAGYLSYFDYNGDGVVNGLDLGQFRVRFGTTLP
jgi:hypothetical protein